MDGWVGFQSPFMFFTVTVMLAGWYGGLGPALFATILSITIADYYFVPPKYSFIPSDVNDIVRIFLYFVTASLISFLCGSLHRANCLLREESNKYRDEEEQRKQSDLLFRNVFDQQFQLMTILTPAGVTREINEVPLQAANYTKDDVLGKYFWDLPLWRHKEDRKKIWQDRLQEAVKADAAITYDDSFLTADGTIRLVVIVVQAIKDEQNDVEFYIIQMRDITERRRTQEALRESEERWRLAIDGMNDGIWDLNMQTNRMYYSPRFSEMLGYDVGEQDDRPESWVKLFHPEDQHYVQDEVDKYLRHEIPEFKIIFRMKHKNGSWRWILSRGIALWNEEGKAIRFTGSHADVTELQEAREKAEAANHAKSEFLANMSHEIRTPMNAVVGLSSLLQTHNLSPEKQKEFIHTLQLSAQSLMGLINDLLDISKIENDQMQLERVAFNIAEMMEEVVSIMSVKAKEKHIDLSVKYDAQLDDNFIGDPLRLRQVIMNLLSNAIKFTEKGTVTVHLAALPHKALNTIDLIVEVMDTGIGISPDKLDTIFSKFSQADTSMTRKYGGTGLGLSISKTLIQLMGGTISVMSTLGLGSKFTIQLPLQRAEEDQNKIVLPRPANTDVAQTQEKDKPMVLLVEDYKGNVIVASSMLDAMGYRWELAENGREAVEKTAANDYDLILMDVQMPWMDGLEATRRIRAHEAAHHKPPVPILAMTAYSLAGDRERCIDAGMNEYISKPFKPEELRDKARALLRESKKKSYE